MTERIEIWIGGKGVRIYDVPDGSIEACLAGAKELDRFEYWRRVTGDETIKGNAMIWSPSRRNRDAIEKRDEAMEGGESSLGL